MPSGQARDRVLPIDGSDLASQAEAECPPALTSYAGAGEAISILVHAAGPSLPGTARRDWAKLLHRALRTANGQLRDRAEAAALNPDRRFPLLPQAARRTGRLTRGFELCPLGWEPQACAHRSVRSRDRQGVRRAVSTRGALDMNGGANGRGTPLAAHPSTRPIRGPSPSS